jgi:retinol-binding protein 3
MRRPILSLSVFALGLLDAGCSRPSNPGPTPAVATTATAVAPADQTPAARQFATWLAAFNSCNRGDLLAYHERYFPYSVASEDVATIDRELGLSHGTGGFEVKKTEGGPNEITVTMKEKLSPRFASVTMQVDAAEPHRVARFDIHPIPTPDEFQSDTDRAANRLDAAKRHALLEAAKQNIRAHYVIPEVGDKMIAALDDHDAHGGYEGAVEGSAFAAVVTMDLRTASHDGHIRLEFGPPPPGPGQEAPEEHVAHLRAMNFGFGTIERLPGNVARMVIDGFPEALPEEKDAIAGFMTQIADADALLLDLRHNHGGDPHTVQVVASYLFDATPVHINDLFRRDTGATEQFWTLRDVKGTRFGSHKPLYVLTSHETFSGGEELAYDLRALKRGVIVGETTGGGAHPAQPYDLDGWFHLIVPWGRPINPITKKDWEGVGVVPDVAVAADAALDEAQRRALADIAKKTTAH